MTTFSLPRFLVFSAVFCLMGSRAAGQWTTPIQITSGPQDDIHPAFATVANHVYPAPNVSLAFARSYGSWSRICVKMSSQVGIWDDSVYFLSSDSSWNDHPSIAQTYNQRMLAWQRDTMDIFYSHHNGFGWSQPIPLTIDGAGNRSPFVAIYDTTFIIVWEKAGRIAFSKFLGGNWTPPVFATPEGDTVNSTPRIHVSWLYPEHIAVIVWEKRKTQGTSSGIVYSVLRQSGLSEPDTVAWTGDNRRPKPMKLSPYDAYFTYESNRTGRWEIYSAEGFFVHDTLQWFDRVHNMSQNPSADNFDASLSYVPQPVIDGEPSEIDQWNTTAAGAWRVVSGPSDSIAVAGRYGQQQYLTPAFGTTDRHPDISAGMQGQDGWRVWTVWESNLSGNWNLYGSHVDIVLDVDEYGPLASAFRLHQNYPNPFNPTTVISFQLPVSGLVSLRIFDLLGREVATLVDGNVEAGTHEVQWKPGGKASGVYFARLVVAGGNGEVKYSKVNKLVLMK